MIELKMEIERNKLLKVIKCSLLIVKTGCSLLLKNMTICPNSEAFGAVTMDS